MPINPQYPSGVTDTRSDLGYGTTKAKFHKHRSFNQYPEPPEEDSATEEEIEASTFVSVAKKLLNYKPVDHLSKNKTDPFYYVGSATKLSEENFTAKGMVPFPKMYKNKQAVSGGTAANYPTGPTSGFQSRSRPTGTKRGFSKPPYPKEEDTNLYSIMDILNKDDDQEHLQDLKLLIRMIHAQQ